LLQATEAQGFMVKWLALTAVVNLSLDWLLIPKYGALGAAIANGVAQTVAVGGVWLKGAIILRASPPLTYFARVGLSAAVMLAVPLPPAALRPPILGLVIGIPLGVVLFALFIRVTGALETSAAVRLESLSRRLPHRLHPVLQRAVRFLVMGRPAAVGQ